MENEVKGHYVYAHYDNEGKIFYVGLSKTKTRAYSKEGRTGAWHIRSRKGYSVEVLFSGLSMEDAISKEEELINKYGMERNGGLLCNIQFSQTGKRGGVKKLIKQDMLNIGVTISQEDCMLLGGRVETRRKIKEFLYNQIALYAK